MTLSLGEIPWNDRNRSLNGPILDRSISIQVILTTIFIFWAHINYVIIITRVHEKLVEDAEEFFKFQYKDTCNTLLNLSEGISLLA